MPDYWDEPEGKVLNLPVYDPILSYGHEVWKRMRSWKQAVEMSFLHRVAGLSLRDRVMDIQKVKAQSRTASLHI